MLKVAILGTLTGWNKIKIVMLLGQNVVVVKSKSKINQSLSNVIAVEE